MTSPGHGNGSAARLEAGDPAGTVRDCGLYVHFPWCRARCTYCDFNTWLADTIPADAFTESVVAEGTHRAPAFAGHRLTTVYFGGGTPSLWNARGVARVLRATRGWFDAVHPDLEVTLECNPEEASPERLAGFRGAGVTRLSLGLQSLDDALLKPLNRRHDARCARQALDVALQAGFRSVSADLMFGLPGQSVGGFVDDLTAVARAGAPHVSAYHLTLEDKTALTRDVRAGRITLPDDDVQADMWEAIPNTLRPFGLEPYEVSSAARPGHHSRHNSNYWLGRPYLGLGPGAHSFEAPSHWTADAVCRRTCNRKNPAAWARLVASDGFGFDLCESVDRQTHLRERMFTGLRRLHGFSLADLSQELGIDARAFFAEALADLVQRELVSLTDEDVLALTPRGLTYANDVFLRFF